MRCKPGDLAIVISAADAFNDWVGRVVKVVRLSTRYKNAWIVDWGGRVPRSALAYKLQSVYDIGLLPISGIPDTEDTTTDEPIKELA